MHRIHACTCLPPLCNAVPAWHSLFLAASQATRHLGFSSNNLQHTFLTFSIAVFLALSLPVDGTDWHAQFKNWTAGDWLILAFQSSIAYVGSAAVMQG